MSEPIAAFPQGGASGPARVLAEFREVRARLAGALIARDTMRQKGIAQVRRDLATQAYTRAVDQLVEALAQLDCLPISAADGARPALAVLEDLLATIAEAEAKLERLAACRSRQG
ncbi:hypothetical protein SAMN04488103_1268 [Gemmobacter aquatilis]|uniref:Uncharacterized protein n=1 Tax=Gemmobacter aquatilis TaxID=933059 RepID=A0A1H8NYW7_9RHOB|nr:hypothetical protein [Gemmobacter aquatilis]SEO34711.1 hypothetical protein SAMN04488103_1268 [Gemmobacter aquatilis]